MPEARAAGEIRSQEPVREAQEHVGVADLPRILPLEEAARELQMSVEHLTDLVQSGRVPAYLAPDGKSMMVPVPLPEPQKQPPTSPTPARDGNDYESRRWTLDEINARLSSIRREDFAHLEGIGLTLREASKRFGVPVGTIDRWTRRGYVRVLKRGTSKSNPTLVNAADVAYCAQIRKIRRQAGIVAGSPLLDEQGNPHLLKRPLSLVVKS